MNKFNKKVENSIIKKAGILTDPAFFDLLIQLIS